MAVEPPDELELARLAAIVDHSSDAILSTSLDGIVQTWNNAATRLYGWRPEEIIGKPIDLIVPPALHEQEAAILSAVARGENVSRMLTERRTKNGETISVSLTVSPIRGSDGTVVAISKIAHDSREQAKLVLGLRERSDQFTALANNIPQLAWLADSQGWIYWYNQRWFEYTGFKLEDMEGWGWRRVHHPDHVDRVVERIQHSWDTGEPWEDLFPLRRADGVFRWFLSRANPLRDEDGNVILWCGTNTDITDELEAKNRIALLIREVNHRSRNMLSTLKAMVNRSSADTAEELAQSLHRRITALASNQELLDGGDWSGARIDAIVEAQLAHIDDAARERVRLDGSDDLTIKAAQAEALGLAIHELATNAEKYGALSDESGSVMVEWSRTTDEAGEEMLQISWTETGGPAVTAPTRTGFGTTLITRNMEHVFGGKVSLDYADSGLSWRALCPASDCLTESIEAVEPGTI